MHNVFYFFYIGHNKLRIDIDMSKTKSEFEYIINTSPIILFNCLSTASGLSEWFCDDVNLKDDKFTFFWDGSNETAILKNVKKSESVKFQWEDDEGEDCYFEMAIRIDDLTKEVALIVTDFYDDDEDELKLLWDNNIHKLKQAIGG